MMTRKILVLMALAGFFAGSPALADPTGVPAKIQKIRVYNNNGLPGAAFVYLDQATPCDTTVYKIDLSWSGSKEVLATALSAFASEKSVQVEATNTGCAGWGTVIQSIYLLK